ncbi:MetQ/NlpA family ABC transporter substrate-binding protein [Lachnospiraceae bacterium 46-61]
MKKRVLALLLGTVLAAGAFVGCSSTTPEPEKTDDSQKTEGETDSAEGEGVTIKIGASPAPHAEILQQAKDALAAEGINIEILEFSDYILPNTALDSGELDANYFQHEPYLISFNEENGTNLVSMGNVHYEPMCIYAGKTTSLEEIPDGAKVSVPNDPTNEARALLLLEANGLLKINADAGINATKLDILENPHNLEIVEMEAAQLPRTLQDVDFAVINGNYAVASGLNMSDALAKEEKDSLGAKTYPNIIAVREGDESRTELQKLVEVLKSDEIKDFISEKYQGAVEPIE